MSRCSVWSHQWAQVNSPNTVYVTRVLSGVQRYAESMQTTTTMGWMVEHLRQLRRCVTLLNRQFLQIVLTKMGFLQMKVVDVHNSSVSSVQLALVVVPRFISEKSQVEFSKSLYGAWTRHLQDITWILADLQVYSIFNCLVFTFLTQKTDKATPDTSADSN